MTKCSIFPTENELTSDNSFEFKPGDPAINQLLFINRDISQSLDNVLDKISVIFDISKAFDKFWHEGLLYSLKQNSISGKILNVITSYHFLFQRKQRVGLNRQH